MINVPYSVKKALKKGIYRINYKINVLRSDGTIDFTMDNSALVSDSVNIDERMCSGDVLKFGLCEGSSLEFQYFNKPNLYGRRLQVLIEVEYPTGSTTSWYSIPMGFFEVKKCSRQADTGIMKVTAYNKLQSEYLDADANTKIQEVFPHNNQVYTGDLLRVLLDSFAIYTEEIQEIAGWDYGASYYVETGQKYRYLSLYGDYGYLGPGLLSPNISTSTNMSLRGAVGMKQYNINPSYPLRINPLVDFDTLDDNYYNFLKSGWEETSINQTVDTMMQRMMSLTYEDTFFDGWIFRVILRFVDDSLKTYSKSAYKYALSNGTFEDLKNTTFKNVKKVYFIYPQYVEPAYYSGGAYYTTGARYLYGEDEYYRYYDENHDEQMRLYSTPKMPDGSNISQSHLYEYLKVYNVMNLEDSDLIEVSIIDMPSVTLRNLQSAVFEMQCQYGQLNRETDLFEGIELNKGGLYPRDDLYPSNSLYPSGASLSGSKAMYSKLWADEGNIRKWRKLVISYKGLDDNNNAVDKIMELVVDPDGTDDYLMDDNWLFKNLVWNDEDVETYANTMVTKMQDVTWFPFEMWCAGLPYLETGDMIEIPLENKHYTSYVLQRQLKGIQDLQDTYINGTLDIF